MLEKRENEPIPQTHLKYIHVPLDLEKSLLKDPSTPDYGYSVAIATCPHCQEDNYDVEIGFRNCFDCKKRFEILPKVENWHKIKNQLEFTLV